MSLGILNLVETFSDIIASLNITKFEQFGSNLRLRARIALIDGYELFIRETILDGKTRKYAFHWQDKNKNLLIRWDNAPDWDVTTFPHHKHETNEKSISASYERTLDQVFKVISKKITQS
jgi:hypothetical protein